MFDDPHPNTVARLRKESSQRSPKVKPTRKALLRLLSFARPYWWQLGVLMGAAFVSSSLNLTYPALVGTVIDSVVTGNVTALHTIMFFLLGLAVLQSLFSFGQSFWMSALGERIVIKLRIQLYSHLQHLPLSFFQDNQTGELLSRLTNDVTRVQAAVTTNIISIVQNIITLLLGLTIVITGPDTLLAKANQFNIHLPISHSGINLGVVLILVAVALIPIVFLPMFTRTYVRKLMRLEMELLSRTTATSEETIGNAKIVKAFTREDYEIERYKTLAWQQFAITRKRVRANPLQHNYSRKYCLWATDCNPERDRSSRTGSQCVRIYRALTARVRHAGRRAWRQTFGWSASTHCHCTGTAAQSTPAYP